MTNRNPALRIGILAMLAGAGVAAGMIGWYGAREIGAEVLRAAWVLPFTLTLHVVQLSLSAMAWKAVIGVRRPHHGRFLAIRWIRESVNAVLPVAQLGGNLVGIRLLSHRGVPAVQGGAGTVIDVTMEALTQAAFTLIGVAVLAATQERPWAPWLLAVVGAMLAAGLGFVLAQKAGLLRLVEALAERLAGLIPAIPPGVLRGLHDEMLRLNRDRRAVWRAAGLHLLAWLLGVTETWMALLAMGRPTGWAEALVLESVGMAARSAGFAVPGALGVQEAGFILAGGLVGVPAEAVVALSMVKRARELLAGVPGVLAWQLAEGHRLLRR